MPDFDDSAVCASTSLVKQLVLMVEEFSETLTEDVSYILSVYKGTKDNPELASVVGDSRDQCRS